MSGHVTGAVAALADELPRWVSLLRAPNPGPMTLDGTNTWVLRAPAAEYAIVVDPGPADEGHLTRIAEHGPIGLILITHGHPDHTEGAARLSELLGGVHVLAVDPAHTIGGEPLTEPGEQPRRLRPGDPPAGHARAHRRLGLLPGRARRRAGGAHR